MSRNCGKRRVVAMALVAALTCFVAGAAAAQAPAFARLVVSDRCVVFIELEGGEIRSALTADGLQSATPVKLSRHRSGESADCEYTLPVPANQLPAGVTAIKADLSQATAVPKNAAPIPYIMGRLAVCRTDDQKAEWQYVARVIVKAGADAESGTVLKLPNLDNLNPVLVAKPAVGKLAVGIKLMAGEVMLTNLRKDGQTVEVKMVVADSGGYVRASKVGPLSAFGFS